MLTVERLVLETICFNFLDGAGGAGSGRSDGFEALLKIGKRMGCESMHIR